MRPKFFSQDALVKTFAVVATFIVVYTAAVQVIQWGGLTGQISPSSSSQRSAYLDSAGGGGTSSVSSSSSSSNWSSPAGQLVCNVCLWEAENDANSTPVDCASATTDTACNALNGSGAMKGNDIKLCFWDYDNEKCTGFLDACNKWFSSLPPAPRPRKDLAVPVSDGSKVPATLMSLARQLSSCTELNVDYEGHSNSNYCKVLYQSAEVCVSAIPQCKVFRLTNNGCETFANLLSAIKDAQMLKNMLKLYNPQAVVTVSAHQAPVTPQGCSTLTSIDVDCSNNPPTLTLPTCGWASPNPADRSCVGIKLNNTAQCVDNGQTKVERCCTVSAKGGGFQSIWKPDPPGC